MSSIFGMIFILVGIYGLASLAALFSEKSGTINLFVNGGMILGAFSYVAVTYAFTEDGTTLTMGHAILGFVVAIAVGILSTMLLAFASIHLQADQVVVGVALGIIAPLVSLVGLVFITSGQTSIPTSSIQIITNFKMIGWKIQIIFGSVILVFVAGLWAIIKFTRFGLRLSAAGENPHSLAASGVSVYKMRYIGLIISGALAGLAGAVAVSSFEKFASYSSSVMGMGYVALAILIIGQWRVPYIIIGSIVFSSMYAVIQYYSVTLENAKWIVFSVPYIVTLIALPMVSWYARGPKYTGIPYIRN